MLPNLRRSNAANKTFPDHSTAEIHPQPTSACWICTAKLYLWHMPITEQNIIVIYSIMYTKL